MRFKILSVDLKLEHKEIEFSTFYNNDISFSDYDVLIIDPRYVSIIWEDKIKIQKDGRLLSYAEIDGGFSKKLRNFMDRRAEEVKLLLEKTGGLVICFLRREAATLNCIFQNYIYEVNIYNWLPEITLNYQIKDSEFIFGKKVEKVGYRFTHKAFNPKTRPGKEINVINRSHPFSHYFFVLKNYIEPEAVIEGKDLLACSRHIAKNKVEEIIALEIPIGQGKFIFLPPFDESTPLGIASGALLDCIRKSLEWSIPIYKPDWLKNYSLPNEKPLLEEMKCLNEKIRKLNEEKNKIQAKIEELEMLKGLLYETGKYGLEPPVRKAFRLIGFNVKDPSEYDKPYDLLAIDGDTYIIGEIEGSKKQIGVDKYRQLLDYVTEATTEGKKCKGILIGNGNVDTEPSKRTEEFTEQAIRGCESQKYCRMTTTELYKAVKAILCQPDDFLLKKKVKESILYCEGEFKFMDDTELALDMEQNKRENLK